MTRRTRDLKGNPSRMASTRLEVTMDQLKAIQQKGWAIREWVSVRGRTRLNIVHKDYGVRTATLRG